MSADPEAARKIYDRVLLVLTEDWFVLSHFRAMIRALGGIAREVIVVTRDTGRIDEITELGARVIPFDVRRKGMNPVLETLGGARLSAILRQEKPDVIHLVGMKPIITGALALDMAPSLLPRVVVHMIGIGHVAISQSWPIRRVIRPTVLAYIARLLRRYPSWLFVEQTDDLAFLTDGGARPGPRVTVLGGAGVDTDHFAALPAPTGPVPVAGYVGRMIRSKGVDTLVEACAILGRRGIAVRADLYGACDAGNPESLTEDYLRRLTAEPAAQVRWHGPLRDVREAWRTSDVFVLAARSREGMPRAMLEAAACGRPLVVTDVPGPRSFVRDGVEGFVLPIENPERLADALARLAGDPELRRRMGAAARARVLDGFTETAVCDGVVKGYRELALLLAQRT